MKKIKTTVSGLILGLALSASASSIGEVKISMDKARSSLIDMLGGKKDADQQKLVKDTAHDADKTINELKAAGKEKQIEELKKVWKDFKATREDKLVPAILAGKTDEAKALATGIQKERLDKMNSLIKQIQGGDL